MVLHGELRGFPSLHGVTGGALDAVRALGELPVVRVGFVAIYALLGSQRLLEVSASVALDASNRRVLTQ